MLRMSRLAAASPSGGGQDARRYRMLASLSLAGSSAATVSKQEAALPLHLLRIFLRRRPNLYQFRASAYLLGNRSIRDARSGIEYFLRIFRLNRQRRGNLLVGLLRFDLDLELAVTGLFHLRLKIRTR